MAKQSINVGTTANDKKGDSLRAAFQKVNSNFTELYTALGLAVDTTLNLGAFEFDGSVMTTTDSTPIVIDQATTVTSDLTVGGDIVPSVANGGNLGSIDKPFRSLFVSNNTIFLGNVPLSLEPGTNELRVNNVPISQTINYADIPNSPTVPADISDLTDTENLLSDGGGANTGDITFANTTISAPNDDAIRIEAKDENGDVRAYFKVDPADGQAEMRALGSPTRDSFSLADGDWVSAQWIAVGGTGYLEFTNAPNILSYLVNAPSNLYIRINDGAPVSKGSSSGSDNDISVDTGSDFPPSTTVVTTVEFYYMDESRIEIDYDGSIDIYGDQLDIDIESTDNINVRGDTVQISVDSTLRLQNNADDEPIEIITDGDDESYTWEFGADGTLTLPEGGDIIDSEGNSVLSGADTGNWSFNSNTLSEGGAGDAVIEASEYAGAKLILQTRGLSNKQWAFDQDGALTFPDSTVQTTAYTGPQTELDYTNPSPSVLPGSINATTITADSNGVTLNLTGGDGVDADGRTLEWTFDVFGQLLLPDFGSITMPNTGNFSPYKESIEADPDILIQGTNNVRIQTNSTPGPMWTFTDDGRIVFPDSTVQTTAFDLSDYQAGLAPIRLESDESIVMLVNGVTGIDASATELLLYSNNHYITLTDEGQLALDPSGIKFSDDTIQTTAWTGILPNPTYSGSDEIGEATPAPLNLNNSAASTLLTQLNLINTGGGPGAGSAIDFWTYTSINDVPEVRLQAVDDGNYSADFAIKIKANDGNGSLTTTWTFGANGKLTVPGDIVGYQTYVSENPADERVTIQPSGSVDKPFLFTTDQTDGTWERSSMELPSAEINKAVSLGFPHNNITTGYIYNQGTDTLSGTEFNNAFNIMSNGTDVKISTVSGGGNKVWKFAQDGDITLPASGDIVDSTGVGQLANRVEGSWTVTAGTNTYSFTVPMDGTYTMWVKGNIPNGIITWNATLSVTNSNVPAIGTQYAWNYTGGGSPILLTAIPDQIRGAAGTISTDATYAGTTSNRFDFGISNTSGASQTVYYGYTRI
jgi:hypothetical protein